jgi:hypothetical protein
MARMGRNREADEQGNASDRSLYDSLVLQMNKEMQLHMNKEMQVKQHTRCKEFNRLLVYSNT